MSSIFGGSDNHPSIEDNFISKQCSDPVQSMDHAFSMIHLRETLEELPLDAETVECGYSLSTDPTGLPKIHGFQHHPCTLQAVAQLIHTWVLLRTLDCTITSHSGELQLPMYGGADSIGRGNNFGIYPTV